MKRIFGSVLMLIALLINLGLGNAAEAQAILSVPDASIHPSGLLKIRSCDRLLADLPPQQPPAPASGPPVEQIKQKIDSSLKLKSKSLPEDVSQKIEAKLKMAQQKAAAKLSASSATHEAAEAQTEAK